MSPMNDIFHNPSFKKDFAFIRQLEHQNKAYQDKIWEKFVGTFNRTEDDIRIVNTRFESHPSGLSSESEKSVHKIEEEDWQNEASFRISSSSLDLKEKNKSISGSKVVLNDVERKKLHKKLNKHLENGTIDKFDVKSIGDHNSKNTKGENYRNKEPEMVEQQQEAYLDRWSKSQSLLSTPKSHSEVSLKEEKVELKEKASNEVERRMSEEIERLKAQLKEKEKIGNKTKSKTIGKKIKSSEARENKKFTIEISAPAELRKSKYYIEKCIGVIKDILMVMNQGIMPPDGSEDYARRQVRTKEFATRFSRIYLYPLLTQVSKLSSAGEKGPTIYSRFTSLYQLTYQSLQACFNHLPNTVGSESYQKLRECLNCAIDICDKSRIYFEKEVNYDNEDYVCIFKSHCVDLSHKIEDNFLSISVNSLLYSKSTRTSLVPTIQNNKYMMNNADNKKCLQKRFSMYNTNLAMKRDKQWKKMMAAFEEKKPKVKSRYRTATFKHRPPVEKINSQTMMLPKQHRLDDKRSLVLLRNTPVVTPINEDNIQTMIQYENERIEGDESEKEVLEEKEEEVEDKQNTTFFVEPRCQVSRGGTRQQEDILTKLLQLVQGTDQENSADMDANLTNTIMVLQKCLSFKNQNTELLRKMENEEEKPLTIHNNMMEVNAEIHETKPKKEPQVTITGTKNAQLICIKDDNSVMSTDETEDSTAHNSPEPTKKKVKSTEVQTSQSQLVEEEGPRLNRSKSNIKISRIKRPRKILQLLPKDYAINIIQYKLMFYKHNKGNYMYKKTTTRKPWELMDKISEDILDYVLLGIAKEIEVNELLENIYNAEFQY